MAGQWSLACVWRSETLSFSCTRYQSKCCASYAFCALSQLVEMQLPVLSATCILGYIKSNQTLRSKVSSFPTKRPQLTGFFTITAGLMSRPRLRNWRVLLCINIALLGGPALAAPNPAGDSPLRGVSSTCGATTSNGSRKRASSSRRYREVEPKISATGVFMVPILPSREAAALAAEYTQTDEQQRLQSLAIESRGLR